MAIFDNYITVEWKTDFHPIPVTCIKCIPIIYIIFIIRTLKICAATHIIFNLRLPTYLYIPPTLILLEINRLYLFTRYTQHTHIILYVIVIILCTDNFVLL